MKKLVVTVVLLLSQFSVAAIINSDLADLHQTEIESAVAKECGLTRELTQVSVEQEVVRVDQGITDIYFTTVLTTKSKVDQYIFDEYKVIVKSVLADMYDHVHQTWGAYSVLSVHCKHD